MFHITPPAGCEQPHVPSGHSGSVLAILAPGQGAQSRGFLRAWDAHRGYTDRLRDLLTTAGALEPVDLLDQLGALSDTQAQARLRDTRLLQPLLVAAGLAAYDALAPVAARISIVAGHSVGALTAAAIAGVIAPVGAVRLAHERGEAMAAASQLRATGMVALTTPDATRLHQVVGAAEALGLAVATRNGAGQVVLAGLEEQVAEVLATPPLGTRVTRLEVAGAFHTEHMRAALEPFRSALLAVTPRDPTVPVVSDVDGAVLGSGRAVLERLEQGLVSCVRWDLSQRSLLEHGVTTVVELPPAGTLSALARRELPGVHRLALTGPGRLG